MNKKFMASILAASILLSGCGSNGRQIDAKFNQDVYLDYMTPENKVTSFNYLVTNEDKNLRLLGNLIDGLVENDRYGNIKACASQGLGTPNSDYTVWEFDIRGGMSWVNSQGEETGHYVTADDFICGLQYVLDAKNESQFFNLPLSIIKNAKEYTEGSVGFDQVGISAVNEYTVRYTLNKSCCYFNTYLVNGAFYPVCRALLNEVKDDFATSPETMWYNGCYYLSSANDQTINFNRNNYYYDLGNVSFEKGSITLLESEDKALEEFRKGDLSYAYVTQDYAANNGKTIDTHMYMSSSSYETYAFMFNFNSNDKQIVKALNDVDFRKSIFNSFNQNEAFITNIEEEKEVKETKDTTTETNTEENTEQVEVVEKNSELNVDVQSTIIPNSFAAQDDGKDYVTLGTLSKFSSKTNFNSDLMTTYQNSAIESLSKVDEKKKDDFVVLFPLTLRVPVNTNDTHLKNSLTNAFASLDSTYVQIEFVDYETSSELNEIIKTNAYDLILLTINAQYGDPSTYLDVFTKEGKLNKEYSHFEDKVFNDLYNLANSYTSVDTRLMAFAECEAYLLENAYVIPYSHGNFRYKVSSINDFSLPASTYGLAHYKLKNVRAFENALTITERKELKASYEEAKKQGL